MGRRRSRKNLGKRKRKREENKERGGDEKKKDNEGGKINGTHYKKTELHRRKFPSVLSINPWAKTITDRHSGGDRPTAIPP